MTQKKPLRIAHDLSCNGKLAYDKNFVTIRPFIEYREGYPNLLALWVWPSLVKWI